MSTSSEVHGDLALRLAEVHHAFEKAFARWVQSHIESSSSPARMRLLGSLHCKGPQIMCDLGGEMGVTARQVTNLVDALEAEGLVRRGPHPTDRRATVIEITPQGAEVACKMWRPFQQKVAGLFRELPRTDQRELLRMLEALHGAVKRRGDTDKGD